MRPYCLHCVIKHLGQAYAHDCEISTGYPKHLLGVIGHLAEASDECVGISPELAAEIRGYRLAVLRNVVGIYEGAEKTGVPYFDLFHKAVMLIKEKGCGNCDEATETLKRLVQQRKDGEK